MNPSKEVFRILTAALTVLGVSFSLLGCKEGETDFGYPIWYGLYSAECGLTPRPGCAYFLSYKNTFKGYRPKLREIYLPTDPIRSARPNGLMVPRVFDELVPVYSYGVYEYDQISSNGMFWPHSYEGWVWKSPETGKIYDSYGYELTSESQEPIFDLAGRAQSEAKMVATVAEGFAKKFHLDPQVPLKLAQAANQWAKIGLVRSRTEADHQKFSMQVFGVEWGNIMVAATSAQRGDKNAKNAFDPVVQSVAKNWKTDPKVVRTILRNWFTDGAEVLF